MYLKSCIFVASSLMLLHVVSAVTLKDLQDRLPSVCRGASEESHQKCKKLYADYQKLAKTKQYKGVADEKCGRLDNVQCYKPEASTANTAQSRTYTCAGNPLKGKFFKETNTNERIPVKQCIDELAGTGGSGGSGGAGGAGGADPGIADKPNTKESMPVKQSIDKLAGTGGSGGSGGAGGADPGIADKPNTKERMSVKQSIDKLAGTGGSGSADPGNADKPK